MNYNNVIKEKSFREGDIYIIRNDYFDQYFRIKNVSDNDVMVEELGVDYTYEFDEDDFRKTCMKEENYELYSSYKIEKRQYIFKEPNYNFILKSEPNNKVISSIKMKIEYDQFNPKNVYLINRKRRLYLDEKFSGIIEGKSVSNGFVGHHNYFNGKVISQKYEHIMMECFKKSIEMTKDYYKTPEGIKEEEEYNRMVEEEKLGVK